MSKKLSYLKCRLLSRITTGTTRLHYRNKKKKLKQQLFLKKYGDLGASLQRLEDYQAYQKFYLQFKQRYNIDIPADVCGCGNFFELIRIPLKKIKRSWFNGKIYPLTECSQYKYLKTRDKRIYLNYLDSLRKLNVMSSQAETWSLKRFCLLEKKINKQGYLPEKSIIVINQDNLICDGLHRACILLYKYGGDCEIPVIQISRK